MQTNVPIQFLFFAVTNFFQICCEKFDIFHVYIILRMIVYDQQYLIAVLGHEI
jgi:hypothetical protein